MPDRDRAFTAPALAARWRVSRDKVRKWIRQGLLTAVNLASAVCGRPLLRDAEPIVPRTEASHAV